MTRQKAEQQVQIDGFLACTGQKRVLPEVFTAN